MPEVRASFTPMPINNAGDDSNNDSEAVEAVEAVDAVESAVTADRDRHDDGHVKQSLAAKKLLDDSGGHFPSKVPVPSEKEALDELRDIKSTSQALLVPEEERRFNVKPIHVRMAAMKIAGYPVWQIAEHTGYSRVHVSGILREPQVNALVQRGMEDAEAQLSALLPKAVQTLNDGLESHDMKDRLAATKIVLSTQGKLAPKDPKGGTGTKDYISNLLQIHAEGNVSVTMSGTDE